MKPFRKRLNCKLFREIRKRKRWIFLWSIKADKIPLIGIRFGGFENNKKLSDIIIIIQRCVKVVI